MHTNAHRCTWRVAAVVLAVVCLAQGQSIRRSGYVTDQAEVIDAESEDTIVSTLDELRRRTGWDSAVVTVNKAASIETLADDLFRSWNQGELGFILIISIQDRKWHLATCDQLQATLNASYRDSLAERCLKPNFRAGNYAAGIIAAVRDLSEHIPSDGRSGSTGAVSAPYDPSRGSSRSWSSPGACTGIGCIVAFLLAIATLGAVRRLAFGSWGGGYWSRPYGGGGWYGGWSSPWGCRRGWRGYRSSGWSFGRSSWGSSFRSSSGGGGRRSTYSGGGGGGSW